MSILDRLATSRLLPLVTIEDSRHADAVATALVAGGLPVVEVALRTPAGIEAITRISARGDVLVGAGTVLTADQVDDVVGAGAEFVVSPGMSRAVVERCQEHGIPILPGAVTASEVMTALDLGVSVVKFFPAAASGGAAAIAALSAPFGDVRFLPTGGINAAGLDDYLALPSVLAVGGSWMLPTKSFDADDPEVIGRIAAAVAQASA